MPHAALLIDIERFHRERRTDSAPERTGGHDLAADLDYLSKFCDELTTGRRCVVRRAYADFAGRDEGIGTGLPPDAAELLLARGIEPVQVFAGNGGRERRAVGLRIALDAGTLVGRDGVDFVVLVAAGDDAWIPVALELRRQGAEVCAVGVGGAGTLGRHCDRVEDFSDLVAASDAAQDLPTDLPQVGAALRALLVRRSPLVFAAVKPLLGRALGAPFDPARFDCEDTGEFLRTYADELGLRVCQTDDDWIVEPADGEPARDAEADQGAPPARERAYTLQPHSPQLYSRLLRHGTPHLYVPSGAEWRALTDALYASAVTPEGRRLKVLHADLVERAAAGAEAAGVADAARKARGVAFVVFKAGCFVCRDGSAQDGRSDFHWSRAAVVADEVRDADGLRARARLFVVRSLLLRLAAAGYSTDVDPRELARELEGGEPAEAEVAQASELLELARD